MIIKKYINKSAAYKIKSGQTVYLCFSTDFLVKDVDEWRSDLHFLFLTKHIERFMDCILEEQKGGYEYANASDVEVYLNSDPQNTQYEVWIPVAKKKV